MFSTNLPKLASATFAIFLIFGLACGKTIIPIESERELLAIGSLARKASMGCLCVHERCDKSRDDFLLFQREKLLERFPPDSYERYAVVNTSEDDVELYQDGYEQFAVWRVGWAAHSIMTGAIHYTRVNTTFNVETCEISQ